MRQCSDCRHAFTAYSSTSYRCRDCQGKANILCKLASQRRRHEVRRTNDGSDISAEEIERRFAAALKEIRQQPSEGLEPYRNYGWLYREPRS